MWSGRSLFRLPVGWKDIGRIDWKQGAVDAAGNLPASENKPDFWDTHVPERTKTHKVEKEYNCCCSPSNQGLRTRGTSNDIWVVDRY